MSFSSCFVVFPFYLRACFVSGCVKYTDMGFVYVRVDSD